MLMQGPFVGSGRAHVGLDAICGVLRSIAAKKAEVRLYEP